MSSSRINQHVSVRTLSLMASLLFAILSLPCDAFQTASSAFVGGFSTGGSGAVPMKSQRIETTRGFATIARMGPRRTRDGSSHAMETRIFSARSSLGASATASTTSSALFPRRDGIKSPGRLAATRMAMAENDDNSVSDKGGDTLLVRAWLSVRKMLARFWVSIECQT